ncbi:hypothetical protein ABZ249_25430 [Nocardiopsis sp. NPDC006139]|uniref:hypothetical protein n=1 Tax=Nocardiopsis sp. NPDC006139 TaxID=3154578 RepID=UPI0033B83C2D
MTFGHDHTQRACETLTALRADLEHLTDLRGVGRVRRWGGWGPSLEQIAAAGARHAAERVDTLEQLANGIVPIGASPAPADLVVLDTLRMVEIDLADLLDAVCDRIAPRTRRSTTNPRRIGQLVSLLTRVGAERDLLDHVLSEARRMHRAVKHALGDTEEVRQLADRCPHCNAKSLRALMDRGVVVCGNGFCRCSDDTCGCHHPSRPRRHTWSATEFLETA